ncbi:GAP family protein [Mycobacterium helveticum]|uniref:GAP family protein n=1 Tax=Mycobacterium helveticum TaxID=2592811 RepID=A0A557Y0Z0_9MYCO|nr:GAP family protein [Mycobacterium helveticum]TVS88382.1 GAP family protein [Mycobacterium helveticum]TVS92240.1 GAP family protein [Mycobacterium helveticum]
MWSTVLLLGLSVVLEPVRIGLVVLMLNRRRPLVQLLVFLCGGVTMGVGVGLVLLFLIGATPLAGHLTVAGVQISTGLVALLVAVLLVTGVSARFLRRVPAKPAPPARAGWLSATARQLLHGDSLYVAAVAGMGAALPSANYLGAMAAILASAAAPAARAEALLAFNAVAFAMAEIPLLSYLVAPRQTRAAAAALRDWLRARTQRGAGFMVGAGGCLMLTLGLSRL